MRYYNVALYGGRSEAAKTMAGINKMEKLNLAICIPTYNRSEIVREFLENASERYRKNGIDTFFFDSSENEETEKVVKEWAGHQEGIYYERVDSAVHANRKVYDIFKRFGTSKYEYIWVCADSIRWEQAALDAVKAAAQKKYDVIVVDHVNTEGLGSREYMDKNSLFLDFAWMMTFFGATILKTSTMLTDVDWDTLIEKYMVPDCINHSHVAFYFEKLNMLDQCRAYHLVVAPADRKASGLKLYSGWHKDAFYVWCHCWPATIRKLPESYRYKAEVVKKHGIRSGLLSYESLKGFRRENILNRQIYKTYKEEWINLTDVSPRAIKLLTLLPSWAVDGWKYRKITWLKKRIKRFCSRFDRVYIYGAGGAAKKYSRYLFEMNIPFEAYLVSEMGDNRKCLNDHEVKAFSDNILGDGRTGILLALAENNAREVLKGTLKDIRRDAIFCEFGIKR